MPTTSISVRPAAADLCRPGRDFHDLGQRGPAPFWGCGSDSRVTQPISLTHDPARWLPGLRPATTEPQKSARRRRDDRVHRDTEMLVEVLGGRARAERRHADEPAVGADDRVPALAHRGLDADLDRRIADHRSEEHTSELQSPTATSYG